MMAAYIILVICTLFGFTLAIPAQSLRNHQYSNGNFGFESNVPMGFRQFQQYPFNHNYHSSSFHFPSEQFYEGPRSISLSLPKNMNFNSGFPTVPSIVHHHHHHSRPLMPSPGVYGDTNNFRPTNPFPEGFIHSHHHHQRLQHSPSAFQSIHSYTPPNHVFNFEHDMSANTFNPFLPRLPNRNPDRLSPTSIARIPIHLYIPPNHVFNFEHDMSSNSKNPFLPQLPNRNSDPLSPTPEATIPVERPTFPENWFGQDDTPTLYRPVDITTTDGPPATDATNDENQTESTPSITPILEEVTTQTSPSELNDLLNGVLDDLPNAQLQTQPSDSTDLDDLIRQASGGSIGN